MRESFQQRRFSDGLSAKWEVSCGYLQQAQG